MNGPGSRSWEILLEVFEHLPRQGPGNRASAALRGAYANDEEALAILVDQIAAEPETHRRHAAFYGYEFFVARRR